MIVLLVVVVMKTDDVEEDDVRDDDIVTTMMTINCGPRQIVTALPTTLLPSIIQVATRSQRNVQDACNRVV